MWVPSHAGIPGNETADFLARSATTKEPQHDLPNSDIHLSISDIKLIIKDHCFSIWQQQYVSNFTALKYKNLFPSITDRNSASSPFLFRLQTGHCKLNAHMHRIGLHSTGLCSTCSVPEDVNHFLIICPKYEHSRSVLNSHLNSMGLRLTMQTLSCPQAFSSLINFVKTSGAIV